MRKQKHWKVSVFDKAIQTIRDDTFYTTDTEAYLVFELIDEDFTPDSATVTVYNIYGKATIHASAKIVDGIVHYEMPLDAIGHPGGWRTQVIFTKDNEDYTTKIIEFDIAGHLLGNKKPSIVVIENWDSFIAHAGELVDDWEQLEEIRQANEQQRELAESARQTEFEANETSRQANELVREEAESNRQSTFETNETERQNEFETNEVEREGTFEINESARQANELTRETAETERVSNEEERISKDSERDSKIETVEERIEENEVGLEQHKIEYAEDKGTFQAKLDSKANKSMLLSPKYDLVYDSCVRDVNAPLDAYSVPMESGHYFENVEDRDSDATLTYEPDGVLLASPSARHDFSPVLIAGFNGDFPYFDIRVRNLHVTSDGRFWFIKYKDKDNWVGVMIGGSYQTITVISSVEGTQTDIAVESSRGSSDERQADPGTIYSLKAEIIRVHRNFAESARALRVFKNEQQLLTVPIPTNAVDFPNRVGFSVASQTEILNFKAGSAR